MLLSFSLRSINASVNKILISTLAFLYSFSDQDRMERDYKIRECLTAILIGVCSMNLWLVWKVFFFYYFVFLLLLSLKWIPVTYFATLLSWQVYILCQLCLLMHISPARETNALNLPRIFLLNSDKQWLSSRLADLLSFLYKWLYFEYILNSYETWIISWFVYSISFLINKYACELQLHQLVLLNSSRFHFFP